MKKTPLLLLAAFAAQLTVTSCGKDEDKTVTPAPTPTPTPTNKELLVGTWKVINYADDSNKNKTMDNTEIYPPDSLDEFRFSFNNDGTGVSYERYDTQLDTTKYKWYLNDDKTLILLPDFDPEDTAVFFVDKVSQSDLVLKDEGSAYYSWIIFKKQ